MTIVALNKDSARPNEIKAIKQKEWALSGPRWTLLRVGECQHKAHIVHAQHSGYLSLGVSLVHGSLVNDLASVIAIEP